MTKSLSNPPSGRRALLCSLGVLGMFTSAPARAADVAFVEASSELDGAQRAASAWNAVDGKEGTPWCAHPDDTSPMLSMGFSRSVTITHLGLVVGASRGDALVKDSRRARVVFAEDAAHRVEVKFRDLPSMQVVELTPPIRGRRVTLVFPGAYEGSTPDAPLCVGEVLLKSKESALTGAQVASRLRAVPLAGRKLLHEWLDDPSAPQRTLLFDVDGTFQYGYRPLLEGKPVKLRGRWSAGERSVTLEVGGKAHKLDTRLTRIDDGERRAVELILEGEGPDPSLAATYRPAPARVR